MSFHAISAGWRCCVEAGGQLGQRLALDIYLPVVAWRCASADGGMTNFASSRCRSISMPKLRTRAPHPGLGLRKACWDMGCALSDFPSALHTSSILTARGTVRRWRPFAGTKTTDAFRYRYFNAGIFKAIAGTSS